MTVVDYAHQIVMADEYRCLCTVGRSMADCWAGISVCRLIWAIKRLVTRQLTNSEINDRLEMGL